jgi:membrane fusion protein, heavy metal efflux system
MPPKSKYRALYAGVAVAVSAAALAMFFGGVRVTVTIPSFGPPTAKAEAQGKQEKQEKTAALESRAPKEPEIPSVELSDSQLAAVKVEPVGDHVFKVEKSAVGSIDFNEDMSVQVFTPYQGRIISLFAKVGDDVQKGQTLFTIDSPDLLQAESTLIAAAGVLELTTKNLARMQKLYEIRAVAQAVLEQAVSDQQTAEGALKAARDAVRIFGKTEVEIDKIVAERKADPTLVVLSSISGRVTARAAAPGLFVQPGNLPAPYTVSDISTMWMLANVIESDIPDFSLGQEVRVKVVSYPDHVFKGKISTIGSTVDPNTHRVFIRSEIQDPEHLLKSGMYASFVIETGHPVRSTAIAAAGVVREGDGTMSAWVTTDRHKFVQRTIEIGLQGDGYDQVVKGLNPGELVASDGAVFLSNMYATRAN